MKKLSIILAALFVTLTVSAQNTQQEDPDLQYATELLKPGTPAPLEYCENRVRDIIVSNRKHALLSSLEQDLLKDALDQEKLIIY